MIICGIASEYNPFHKGHQHQIDEIRRCLGKGAAIICAMSGNFVQRGGIAITDKYKRAEMAVKCGADLAVELPVTAALSSAEGYAKGAAGVLKAFGCEYMSFGAETPDEALFLRAAEALNRIKEHTGGTPRGLSYAARKQEELRKTDPEASSLLDFPNNTLGVEYCRFMYPMKPLIIRRICVEHNAYAPRLGYASAGYLRKLLLSGDASRCKEFMPVSAYEILEQLIKNGEAPAELPDSVMLGILRKLLYEGRLSTGSRDGFDERIQKAVYSAASYKEAVNNSRSKYFPLARIRRELMRLVLGIPKDASVEPEYIRVLGIGRQGRALIKKAVLPVIVKPVSEKRLPFQKSLLLDSFADDFFALGLPEKGLRAGGSHYRKTPFCLK